MTAEKLVAGPLRGVAEAHSKLNAFVHWLDLQTRRTSDVRWGTAADRLAPIVNELGDALASLPSSPPPQEDSSSHPPSKAERMMATATGPLSVADFSQKLADDIWAISDGVSPDKDTLRGMIRARLEVGLEGWQAGQRAEGAEAGLSFKYFPLPWTAPEGEPDGAHCRDANGQTCMMIMWPAHPPEETEAVEQEAYRLMRLIPKLLNAAAPPVAELGQAGLGEGESEISPDKTNEIEWGRESVYTHLRGNKNDDGGCYGCPVEDAVAKALTEREVFTDPIGRALLALVERLAPPVAEKTEPDGVTAVNSDIALAHSAFKETYLQANLPAAALGSGQELRGAIQKLHDEASKNAAAWHSTHDSSREQRAHWMTFYQGRKAAFEEVLAALALPLAPKVPMITPQMMSGVFAKSVNNTDPEHGHLYDHRIAAAEINKLLRAERDGGK